MRSRRAKLSSPPHADLPRWQARAWRVLHACTHLPDVAMLVEGEADAGMYPQVVTANGTMARPGEEPKRGSQPAHRETLLTAWHDVRRWRGLLGDADPLGVTEIVHAHTFSAGMAAVRSAPVVVYDIARFVEDPNDGSPAPGAWVSRSFQVAEQFVIGRAGATVVRSLALRERALARGAQPGDLFTIPAPLTLRQSDTAHAAAAHHEWREGVSFYAAGFPLMTGTRLSPELLSLVQAMAAVSAEVEGVSLAVELDAGTDGEQVRTELLQLNAGLPVSVISPQLREPALAISGVALLLHGASTAELGLEAMLHGRALLAADVPEHRDLSEQGRGCIWFRQGDVRDLACRAAFLARNHDFLRGLGAAGKRHIVAARSPLAVAERYDAVYRHAARRRRSGPETPWAGLQLARACV